MPNLSNHLTIDVEQTIVPQSASAAVKGSAIDLAGAGSAEVIVEGGTAGTAAVYKIEESDTTTDADFAAVADSDLIGVTGNSAGVTLAASTTVQVGYVGSKRYVRVHVMSATTALVSASVVRAHLRQAGPQPV